MCKNNLKEILLSHYNDTYFEKLNDIQKNQGNRFLLSDCPKNAEDVRLLFLNLNPQMALADEEANKPCMNKFTFWFDEGWNGSQHFRNLFYVIGEKLEDPDWSYEKNHKTHNWDTPELWNDLKSKNNKLNNILSAYAYPLRTHDEDALKQMTRRMKDDIKKEIEKEIKKKMENETEEKIKKEIKKEMKKDQTKRIKKMLESKPDWAPVLLAEELWNKIIELLPKPLKIIVTGNGPFYMICEVLEKRKEEKVKITEIKTNRLHQGSPTSIKWASMSDGTKILCFPQVTKFPLIGYTGNEIDKTKRNEREYTYRDLPDYKKAIDDAFDFLLK